MNVLWTIIIGLGASVIGGLISGILVMRKITHDTKRQYARQIAKDFELMSVLFFMNARDYLESLDFNVKEFNANQPEMDESTNQEIVNRVRKEHESGGYEKRLEKFDIGKLISQAESLLEEITHDTTGFRKFFSKYPLQTSYFDALYRVSSAVEIMIFQKDSIQTSVNEWQKRNCVSNITYYLLDALEGLLLASSEIKYYLKTKSWTWRFLVPKFRV